MPGGCDVASPDARIVGCGVCEPCGVGWLEAISLVDGHQVDQVPQAPFLSFIDHNDFHHISLETGT